MRVDVVAATRQLAATCEADSWLWVEEVGKPTDAKAGDRICYIILVLNTYIGVYSLLREYTLLSEYTLLREYTLYIALFLY